MKNELRLNNDEVEENKCQSMKKYKMYILVYMIVVSKQENVQPFLAIEYCKADSFSINFFSSTTWFPARTKF